MHAVAGIGNPARFFRDLRARGLDVDRASVSRTIIRSRRRSDVRRRASRAHDGERCRKMPRRSRTRGCGTCPWSARFSDAQAQELLDRVVCVKLGPLRAAGG